MPAMDSLGVGGPRSFLSVLVQKFMSRGIEVVLSNRFEDCDALLFAIHCDPALTASYRARKRPTIQRLDGVYYWKKHGWASWVRNKSIRRSYETSSFKVFQSEYSRQVCEITFGPVPSKASRLIYNAVDTDVFYPGPPTREVPPRREHRMRYVVAGNFRNMDMLAPVVMALDLLAGSHVFSFQVIGPVARKITTAIGSRPYLQYMGQRGSADTAALLRNSDVFLFSSLNPPCPNAVIEATACGLPVVAFDDGSMPELLPHQTELLAGAGKGLFRSPSDLSPVAYAECINRARKNLSEFRQRACMKAAERHEGLEACAIQYEQAVRAAIEMSP